MRLSAALRPGSSVSNFAFKSRGSALPSNECLGQFSTNAEAFLRLTVSYPAFCVAVASTKRCVQHLVLLCRRPLKTVPIDRCQKCHSGISLFWKISLNHTNALRLECPKTTRLEHTVPRFPSRIAGLRAMASQVRLHSYRLSFANSSKHTYSTMQRIESSAKRCRLFRANQCLHFAFAVLV